ncbi:MAG: TonB-dependent receptor, partial [Flavobacteriaceae bacterium]|nr:TonB-dependent receptor [Flavobacteriaceae bacterium]
VAGQGPIGSNQIIPQRTIIDVALNYQISRAWSTQLSVINATDRVYMAARHPAGLRPGHPRGISLSLNYQY